MTQLRCINGRLYAPRRLWMAGLVGYAITASREDDLLRMLDDNIGVVDGWRLLHLDGELDDTPAAPGGWKTWYSDRSTFQEDPATWQRVDWLLAEMKARGYATWMTVHHRRRFGINDTADTPFGHVDVWDELFLPRFPIKKSEIHNLHFWDEALFEMVADQARKMVDRFGDRIDVLNFWNEQTAVRSKCLGYLMSERLGRTTPLARAFYRSCDQFGAATGVDVSPKSREMTKHMIQRLGAWVDFQRATALKQRIADFPGLINVSANFGDGSMACLVGQRAGHVRDFHLYSTPLPSRCENGKPVAWHPDPLSPETVESHDRTIGNVARASQWNDGLILACSEVAGVIELNGGSKASSYYAAPELVARQAAEAGVDIVSWYAAHSHPLHVPAKNLAFSAFRSHEPGSVDQEFLDRFRRARDIFHRTPKSTGEAHQAAHEDLFGFGTGTGFSVPLPGAQGWSSIMRGGVDVSGIDFSWLGK